MKKTSTLPGEFELIARYFAPLAKGFPGAYGLLDDAAVIAPLPGHELVAKTDAIVGGVHFLPDDPPDLVARKALRVNLSDLAAKGAVPRAYMYRYRPPHARPSRQPPSVSQLYLRAATITRSSSPHRRRCSVS